MAEVIEIKPKKSKRTRKAVNAPELTKEIRIKEETARLLEHYAGLPANKMFLAERLISRAAFQRVTLEDLETEINENGTTEKYQNGERQNGMKQSAAVQAYNSMYKNYQATLRDLAAMVPEQKQASRLEAFMSANE